MRSIHQNASIETSVAADKACYRSRTMQKLLPIGGIQDSVTHVDNTVIGQYINLTALAATENSRQ
jgi:hypothetical protein